MKHHHLKTILKPIPDWEKKPEKPTVRTYFTQKRNEGGLCTIVRSRASENTGGTVITPGPKPTYKDASTADESYESTIVSYGIYC